MMQKYRDITIYHSFYKYPWIDCSINVFQSDAMTFDLLALVQ